MSILKIAKIGHPILSKKAKLVDKISTSLIVDNTDIKNDTHWKDNSSFLEELNNMIEFRKSKL